MNTSAIGLHGRARAALSFVMLVAALSVAPAGPAVAMVIWTFDSPGTGVTGSVTFNEGDDDYAPGNSATISNGAIIDYIFTLGDVTWTASDSFGTQLRIIFGATVSPSDLVNVALDTRNEGIVGPPLERLILMGGHNGSLTVVVQDVAPAGSSRDGTFSTDALPSAPEPATLALLALGLAGLGFGMRKRA